MLGSNLVHAVWRRWSCIIWRRRRYTTFCRFGVGLHSVLRLRLIILVVVLLLVVLVDDWRSRLRRLRRSTSRVESWGRWNLLWSRWWGRTLSRRWRPFRSRRRRSVGLLRGISRQGFALRWGVDHYLRIDAVLAVRIINVIRGHCWVSRPGWRRSCSSRTVQRRSILRRWRGPLRRRFS